MNERDLETIWNYIDTIDNMNREEKIPSCCDNKENIVKFVDSITCKVCGVVQGQMISNNGYSDQHSILVPGMSSSIGGKDNLSKKLTLTNYKCSGNKAFQNQKNDWVMRTELNEKIESCHAGIPENVVAGAINLFRMFENPSDKKEKMIVRRNVRASIVSACLYLSCKKNGIFRSPMEIGEILDVKKSLVIKGCKIIRERLCTGKEENLNTTCYIPRICSDLSLPFKIQKEAVGLLESCSKMEYIKKLDPRILNGAILYMTCINNSIPETIKKDIATVTGVSEVSISRTLESLTSSEIFCGFFSSVIVK